MASLEQLAVDLTKSVSQAFPTGEKPYHNVSVVFLLWQNDDIRVGPAVEALSFVFKNVYGFTLEPFTIPSSRTSNFAQRELVAALIQFAVTKTESWKKESN